MTSTPTPPPADIDPRLLEVLVCPVTRTTLDYNRVRGELVKCLMNERAQYEQFGGFGSVLLINYDFAEDPGAWHRSLQLVVEDSIPPGLAILFTALAFNALGESLRVALDPTMKHR